jgi:outer membrane receptor protein involved in Fe transport
MRRFGYYTSVLKFALLCGAAMPAYAQEVPSSNSVAPSDAAAPQTGSSRASASDQNNASDQSGDIIVTALRHDSRIQDTPIAISAISGTTLANSGVQSLSDLTSATPSLSIVGAGPSARSIVIRGIASAGEPTVGLYYDETPVTGLIGPGNNASSSVPELRLFDVDRVESLRGPQGTLYGSGSMGGTLRIIYKKPEFKTEASVDASIGGTEGGGLNTDVSAMINVPLSDTLAVRTVGFFRRNDGYLDNTTLGINNINVEKNYGGRVFVRFQPIDRLTLDASAYINYSDYNTGAYIQQAGKFKTNLPTQEPTNDRTNLYSLTGKYDFGGVTLTATGSYMDRRLINFVDVSAFINQFRAPVYCLFFANGGTPCNATQLANYYALIDGQVPSGVLINQHLKATTGELRLGSSTGRPFNWTIGGFYDRRVTDVDDSQVNANPLTGLVVEPLIRHTQRLIGDRLTQLAAYGEVSWDLTKKFNVSVGLRYFNYKKEVTGQNMLTSILPLGAVAGPPVVTRSSESGVVSKFNASYKFSPNVMVYATASQGFRPGGVNQALGIPTQFNSYKSDKLWNYEAGIKTTSFNHKLLFDIDAFQIDWTNLQVSATSPSGAFSFITNAGGARVRGIEAETTFQPVRGLSLSASGTYLDAVLTEDMTTANIIAAGRKGDRMPNIPRWAGNVSAQYQFPLTDVLGGYARIDYRYTGSSDTAYNPTDPTSRHNNAYALVNTRIGVEDNKSGWGAYFFVTNLLNSQAIMLNYTTPITGTLTNIVPNTPRTYGLNLRKSF